MTTTPTSTPPLRWGCVVHRSHTARVLPYDIRNASGSRHWNSSGGNWSDYRLDTGSFGTEESAIADFNDTCTTPPPDWSEPKPASDAPPKPAEVNGVPVGTCWRNIPKFYDGTDRLRLRADGKVECVFDDGRVETMAHSGLHECLTFEAKKMWSRCPDEPLKPTSPLRALVDRIRRVEPVENAEAILRTYTLEVEIAAYRTCLDKLGGGR